MGAEGIIVGSLIYFYDINALTKTYVERVGYLNMVRGRRAFRNEVGGAAAVAGRSGLTAPMLHSRSIIKQL